MQVKWFSHLKTKEEQEQFKQTVLNSQIVLDKLREIVYNILTSSETVKSIDYDTPSWSHKQAHLNGRTEALTEVLELLNFDKK